MFADEMSNVARIGFIDRGILQPRRLMNRLMAIASETALPPRFKMLDELLPLLEPRQTALHENVTFLEANDVAQLAELAVNPKIRRYLLARLSDTVALVDPGHSEALAKALLAEGHTPKMVRGVQP